MLAEVALALRVLDDEVRGAHLVADAAQDRLHARGAEDRVVDVVEVGRVEVAVAAELRVAVGGLEEQQLELGRRERRPAALGQARDLRAQDLPRRGDDRRVVEPLHVGEQQRRARQPGRPAQRREVGRHLEVAVAALPRAHRVAVDGVHLDVDGQQVVAGLGSVTQDGVQEVARGEALSLQASLHVGEREHHRVDLLCGDCVGEARRASFAAKVSRPCLVQQPRCRDLQRSAPRGGVWSIGSDQWRSRSTSRPPTRPTSRSSSSSQRGIERGALAPGDKLAPERELSRDAGRQPDDGPPGVRGPRSGAGWSSAASDAGRSSRRRRSISTIRRVAGFSEQMEAAGLEPGAELLSRERVAAAAEVVARRWRSPPARRSCTSLRLRSGGGVPLTIEDFWVPLELFPGIERARSQRLALRADGRALRARSGRAPSSASSRSTRRRPTHGRSACVPRSPLMLVERIAYDAGGTPVEFARDRHRGDRARFVIEVAPRVPEREDAPR